MKIETIKIYTMHLSDEEFALLNDICGDKVNYGYNHYNDYWEIKLLSEQMMNNIINILGEEMYIQGYEKENIRMAELIRKLLDGIYHELEY